MFHHDVLLFFLPFKPAQQNCAASMPWDYLAGCCCGCLLSDAPGRTWHGLCCWGSTRYLQGYRMWRESYQTLELDAGSIIKDKGELFSWMGKDDQRNCIYCCKFWRITSQVVEVIAVKARSSPADRFRNWGPSCGSRVGSLLVPIIVQSCRYMISHHDWIAPQLPGWLHFWWLDSHAPGQCAGAPGGSKCSWAGGR